MIYFDQAASSFPKPPEVVNKMVDVLTKTAANPGRGGHKLAREAEQVIRETRERAARIFGCSDPNQCLFFSNATIALNQAIKGLSWQQGDHIIASSLEHNSMRRPLEFIKQAFGVNVTYIKWTGNSMEFVQSFKEAFRKETKLVALTHASNVTGDLLPIEPILKYANDHHVLTLIDASQTAGHIPIHMQTEGIRLLAFPGHKGLLGPQGTGMLLIEGDIDLNPIHHGGTGVFSEEIGQPSQWPEKFESGTLNTPGIAGLSEALKLYEKRKDKYVSRETCLINHLKRELDQINGVTVYGNQQTEKVSIPIVAFNVNHVPSQEVAMILDSHYKIAVRGGLHCSPLAHETLKTTEQGVVRVSLSMYNTEDEVKCLLQAVKEIIAAYKDL